MSKILIVDDDKLIVSALSIRLRAEGHEIRSAYDGTTAVEEAKFAHPDLIIMDINLPFSSGLKAVRQIREGTSMKETPVIFLTASKVPALRKEAEAMGAAGFLEKPYEAEKVLALVRTALAARIVPTSPRQAAAPKVADAKAPARPADEKKG
jgi:two-component system, chemotaxis family, chemotaxis protein CheY